MSASESPNGERSDLLQSQLEASIVAGPLVINTKATVDQVALLLRRTAEELINAKIVEAPSISVSTKPIVT